MKIVHEVYKAKSAEDLIGEFREVRINAHWKNKLKFMNKSFFFVKDNYSIFFCY